MTISAGAWMIAAYTTLLGGMLLLVPRITRRGLLFGVYVGEETSRSPQALALTRQWTRIMLIVVGGSIAGSLLLPTLLSARWGISTAVFVLLGGFFASYLGVHRKALALARPAPSVAATVLEEPEPGSLLGPAAVLVASLVAGGYACWYSATHFVDLPERLPVHWTQQGVADGWKPKSWPVVMLSPAFTLLMGVCMAGMTWLVARAKRVLRIADDGRSAVSQRRFRRVMVVFVALLGLIVVGMMTVASVDAVDRARGMASDFSTVVGVLSGLLAVVSCLGVLAIMILVGQGGSRVSGGESDAPLAEALADNRHWKLGLIYFNPVDPAFLVENRFGLGYTLNFGNLRAVLALLVYFGLILGFVIAANQV